MPAVGRAIAAGVGVAADMCVVGSGGVIAWVSHDTPEEQTTGVDPVIVNGAMTWRDGQPLTTCYPASFSTATCGLAMLGSRLWLAPCAIRVTSYAVWELGKDARPIARRRLRPGG